MQQAGCRGELHDNAAQLVELWQRIDHGELVFVQRASRARCSAGLQPVEPEEIIDNDDWIEILVADGDDEPVVGAAYELELPDEREVARFSRGAVNGAKLPIASHALCCYLASEPCKGSETYNFLASCGLLRLQGWPAEQKSGLGS